MYKIVLSLIHCDGQAEIYKQTSFLRNDGQKLMDLCKKSFERVKPCTIYADT